MSLVSNYDCFPFGSLWYLPDSKLAANWKLRRPFVRQQNRTRHPAMSILEYQDAGAAELVPVLFGHSGNAPWAFVVTGLSHDRPQNHVTSFFDALHPLPYSTFTTVDSMLGRIPAERNRHRPSLSEHDKSRLRRWLAARGRGGRR